MPDNVEKRINSVYVECIDGEGKSMITKVKPDMKDLAEIKSTSLKPKETYTARVVAVYEDGFKAKSEKKTFTAPGIYCNIYFCYCMQT